MRQTVILILTGVMALSARAGDKELPLLTALNYTRTYGKPETLTPANDRKLKSHWIAKQAEKKDDFTFADFDGFLDRDVFLKHSQGESTLTLARMEKAVSENIPESRKNLYPKLRTHAELLTTQFDTIDPRFHEPLEQFVTWIVEHYKPGLKLGVIIICTGNTRRSMIGETLGNLAASYYGLTDLKFYSGGTDPDAFNPRTIATLKEVGFEIEVTGQEATRGAKNDPNPIYAVRWGKGLETVEYSKKYTDALNPQKDFAALLVCSEADKSCPKVTGASVRIAVPYLDPKAFDGAAFESAKYAERRDDMGRLMLSAMMQAKRRMK